MTPATGVPLLQAQQPPAETFTLSHVQTRTPTTGLYTPTAVLSMGEDASSSQLRRTSHEHARRQEFGLNVQTEFAPPPKSLIGKHVPGAMEVAKEEKGSTKNEVVKQQIYVLKLKLD